MKDKKKDYDESKITGFFDKDTEFQGDLSFRGSFRIDGHFKGKINSESMLIIGEEGKVEADIKVGYLIVNGEVKGNIQAADKVEIHSRGRVIGTVSTPKLAVEEGAYMEASCHTGELAASPPTEAKDKPGESC
jgi:cytoskeletal protein CcmA (bactofilin family)